MSYFMLEYGRIYHISVKIRSDTAPTHPIWSGPSPPPPKAASFILWLGFRRKVQEEPYRLSRSKSQRNGIVLE